MAREEQASGDRLGQGGQAGAMPTCGDLDIAIDRRGAWFYRGSRIERPALVRLFAGVLRRESDGRHWLVTPAERGRVAVEDVAFLAVELRCEQAGRGQSLHLRTNLDEWLLISERHPLKIHAMAGGGPAPYLQLHRGLEARVTQSVFFELAELAVQGPDGTLGVWSDGSFFPLDGME